MKLPYFLPLITLPFLLLTAPLQAQEEAKAILEAALNYPALDACWCEDTLGQPMIAGIAAHNQLTALGGFNLAGEEVAIQAQFPEGSRHIIELKRLSVNASRSRARVKIRYHDRVRANLRLHWINGLWRVKGALIRQKEACEGQSGGRRFVWNF